MGILQTVSSLIEVAKKAQVATDAVRDSQAKLAMAELMRQLAELKGEVAGLVKQNQDLREQNEKLTKQTARELTLVGDVYMDGGDGPFCTTCSDRESQRVRLKEQTADFQQISGLKYVCPVCKTKHKGDG